MAYESSSGTNTLRAEVVDSLVRQTAERSYKFLQAVAVVPTNAWKNSFYREQTTIPAGQSGNLTSGIPRGANFPQYSIGWDEVSVRIIKYGLEDSIAYEDILSDNINVQARTIIRLTEGVVKSVDDSIFQGLTENQIPNLINSLNVITATHGGWDEASAAIIDDILNASSKIALGNYDTSDLILFVSPKDKRSIMTYLAGKGSAFPSIAEDVVENGKIGQLCGITLIESISVAASWALMVKPKTCATFKELVSLRSTIIEDPYKSVKVRVTQEGVLELTDPKAVCAIYGTQDIA